MREKHLSPLRVEGGYKAIRQIVLPHFSKSWPLIVITGMTGSQKTEVLNGAPNPIDLEGLANHRGSAFGQLINTEQPKQATFENNLSVALANSDSAQKLVFEDESRLVGQCIIPPPLYAQLTVAPLVRIEASVQSRAEYIFKSYVQLSLERAERGQVREHFQLVVAEARHAEALSRLDAGERMLREAGAERVYAAIATLRKLGLREHIGQKGSGYLIHPDVPVVVHDVPV